MGGFVICAIQSNEQTEMLEILAMEFSIHAQHMPHLHSGWQGKADLGWQQSHTLAKNSLQGLLRKLWDSMELRTATRATREDKSSPHATGSSWEGALQGPSEGHPGAQKPTGILSQLRGLWQHFGKGAAARGRGSSDYDCCSKGMRRRARDTCAECSESKGWGGLGSSKFSEPLQCWKALVCSFLEELARELLPGSAGAGGSRICLLFLALCPGLWSLVMLTWYCLSSRSLGPKTGGNMIQKFGRWPKNKRGMRKETRECLYPMGKVIYDN
ncbi:hypothetical protein DUI87_32857 [Hirundo rustica rustica]|uniref:Uncharacterized protein n=1 Tax=Hirundo rustica rustica TaxID=333673 RepID=A0A3M0ISG4_HIRRU|nr:hypothetical protein DUI87_32857 [Hirundo rustica rustica]